LGSPRSPGRACFHARRAYSTSDRPPGRCHPGFILPCLVSSSEFLRFSSRPRPFGPGSLPGFRSLSRHHRGASTRRGEIPSPHYVPSTGFLNLSTASSAPRLAGLFHPAATSRDASRSGVSLPAQHRSLIGSGCPLAVGGRPLSKLAPGGHGRRAPASRPCSARGRVAGDSVISRLAARSPPRVRPPPGSAFAPEPRLTRGIRS